MIRRRFMSGSSLAERSKKTLVGRTLHHFVQEEFHLVTGVFDTTSFIFPGKQFSVPVVAMAVVELKGRAKKIIGLLGIVLLISESGFPDSI